MHASDKTELRRELMIAAAPPLRGTYLSAGVFVSISFSFSLTHVRVDARLTGRLYTSVYVCIRLCSLRHL